MSTTKHEAVEALDVRTRGKILERFPVGLINKIFIPVTRGIYRALNGYFSDFLPNFCDTDGVVGYIRSYSKKAKRKYTLNLAYVSRRKIRRKELRFPASLMGPRWARNWLFGMGAWRRNILGNR